MTKSNSYYFKKAFILCVPISVFIIVRDLFDLDLDTANLNIIFKLFLKGIFVGIVTATVLGLVNLFAKKETLMKK